MAKVLRILSAAALLAVVAAGCGGAARPQKSAVHGVPARLAQDWEGQASAIATAAAAGKSCQALQLAASLRDDVVQSKYELPVRVRRPLLTGVNALAGRITCTPPATTPKPPVKPKPPAPKPKPPKPPGPPGHREEHHKGHHRGRDG
jgi:hypothetical protein